MDSWPDAPALVLVALSVASLLLLVEVALPTLGLAGLSAAGLGGLAIAMLAHQNDPWWPLLLCAVSVCLWAIFLVRRHAGLVGQAGAATLFAASSTTYGVLARDPLTVIVGIGGSAAIAAGFPRLMQATERLLGGQPQLGMEALVGRTARVVRWSKGQGTVRAEGVLWNARSDSPVRAGEEVIVAGYDGMTLDVVVGARR